MTTPSCYNRPPFKDTVCVQDGWHAYTEWVGWNEIKTRLPRMVEIPDPMSKTCQQHGQMGEATLHPEKWDCAGCCWKPES